MVESLKLLVHHCPRTKMRDIYLYHALSNHSLKCINYLKDRVSYHSTWLLKWIRNGNYQAVALTKRANIRLSYEDFAYMTRISIKKYYADEIEDFTDYLMLYHGITHTLTPTTTNVNGSELKLLLLESWRIGKRRSVHCVPATRLLRFFPVTFVKPILRILISEPNEQFLIEINLNEFSRWAPPESHRMILEVMMSEKNNLAYYYLSIYRQMTVIPVVKLDYCRVAALADGDFKSLDILGAPSFPYIFRINESTKTDVILRAVQYLMDLDETVEIAFSRAMTSQKLFLELVWSKTYSKQFIDWCGSNKHAGTRAFEILKNQKLFLRC